MNTASEAPFLSINTSEKEEGGMNHNKNIYIIYSVNAENLPSSFKIQNTLEMSLSD